MTSVKFSTEVWVIFFKPVFISHLLTKNDTYVFEIFESILILPLTTFSCPLILELLLFSI